MKKICPNCGVTGKLFQLEINMCPQYDEDGQPWYCAECTTCGWCSETFRTKKEARQSIPQGWAGKKAHKLKNDPGYLKEKIKILEGENDLKELFTLYRSYGPTDKGYLVGIFNSKKLAKKAVNNHSDNDTYIIIKKQGAVMNKLIL